MNRFMLMGLAVLATTLSTAIARELAVAPDGTAFVLIESLPQRSRDNGTTWQRIAAPGGSRQVVSLHPAAEGRLYALSFENRALVVSQSVDRGDSWTRCGRVGNDSINDLLATPDGLYAATEEGLAVSTDRCASWKWLDRKLRPAWLAAGTRETMYAVFDDFVYASDDRGSHWKRGTKRFDKDRSVGPPFVLPDGSVLLPGGNHLFRSIDRGGTWQESTRGLVPPVVAVLATAEATYAGGVNGTLYRSTDRGASWAAFGKGLEKCGLVSELAEAPNRTMFALCLLGVVRSTDRGQNWELVLAHPRRNP